MRLPDVEGVHPWVEAAGGLWISRFFGPPPGDAEGLFLRFLTLARAQYGAELSYVRLHAAERDVTQAATEGIAARLAQAADLHAFLVSAALYWTTLREVLRQVKEPNLNPKFAEFEDAASTAKTAREHVEHLNERIRQGRDKRFGTEMPPEVFRAAIGAFDDGQITFGNESFPIDEMLQAPSLSTSGETLTIEVSMTSRARTELRRNVGEDSEWSWG